MPKIPKYQSQVRIPSMPDTREGNVGAFSSQYKGQAQAAQGLQELNEAIYQNRIKRQAEQDYNDTIIAYTELRDWSRLELAKEKEKKGKDARYENSFVKFDERYKQKVEEIRGKLSKGASARFLKLSESDRDSSLNQLSNHIAIEAREYQKQVEDAFVADRMKAISNDPTSYAKESEGLLAYIDNTHQHGESTVLLKKQYTDLLRRSQLDSLLMVDTYDGIKETERYFNSIKKDIGDQRLIDEYEDKFKSRKQTLKNEIDLILKDIDNKRKEYLKQQHDDEERNLGNMFVREQFGDALNLIRNSSLLTGDEKKTWYNAVQSILTKDKDKVSDEDQAIEIMRINRLIADRSDPEDIKKQIVMSDKLGKEDKEQYLNKVDTSFGAEIDSGLSAGYKDIYDLIVPKRGDLAVFKETKQEAIAVKNAQMELDEWVKSQTKNNKFPSYTEVRKKAMDIANNHQISFAEQLEYQQQSIEQLKSEMEAVKNK